MTIYALGDDTPRIDDSVYVADSATIIGKVHLSKDVTVWPRAVLRGVLGPSGSPVCCVRNGFADDRTARARGLPSCASCVPPGCHGGTS